MDPVRCAKFDGVAVHDNGECFVDEVGVGCCVLLKILSDTFNSLVCFDVGIEHDDVAVEEHGVGGDLVAMHQRGD